MDKDLKSDGYDENLNQTIKEDADIFLELSLQLSAISNPNRIRILNIINNSSSDDVLDARRINMLLRKKYSIDISNQGLRKHLIILMESDILTGNYVKNPSDRNVLSYKLNNKAIDNLVLHLNELSNNLKKFSSIYSNDSNIETGYKIRVLSGDDENKVFKLNKNEIKVGRIGDIDSNDSKYEGDILLSNSYMTVSRAFKPHATLKLINDYWTIVDEHSLSKTFVNGEKLNKGQRKNLKSGDVINLSSKKNGASLLFTDK